MEKVVKKIGGSFVLSLSKEEREIHRIAEGDIVNFTITNIRRPIQVEDIPKEEESSTGLSLD